MGRIVNDYVVVNIQDHSKDYNKTRNAFQRLQGWNEVLDGIATNLGSLIHGPIPELVNGGETWIMASDGSKEGWDTSDKADEVRAEFIKIASACEYADVVHFTMGGDDCITRIVFQSDNEE